MKIRSTPQLATLLLLLALPLPAGAAAGNAGKAAPAPAAPAAAAAKPAAKAAPALTILEIEGRAVTDRELEPEMRSQLKMSHMYRMGQGASVFDELLRGRVDERLLYAEALAQGLEKKALAGIYRFRKNAILAGDLRISGINAKIAVDEKEIDARMPKELRTLSIRQCVFETREEAEAARVQLKGGADFIAMIREKSISPEVRKDGLLFDYKAGGGIFSPEQEACLFALPPGEYSEVLELGTGFAVATVEAAKDPDPKQVQRLRAKARDAILQERSGEEVKKILDASPFTVVPRERMFELVKGWWEQGLVPDAVVVEVEGDRFRFPELVVLNETIVNHSLKPDTLEMLGKFLNLANAIASDHVLAREAERRGLVPSPNAQAALDFFRVKALLDELLQEQITAKVTVAPGELRPYYERKKADFSSPESVEVSHVLVKDQAAAREALAQLKGGRPFEEVVREKTADDATKEKAGYLGFIATGDTVPDFEAAAFALQKPGDLSPPVKTVFGWHVIKLHSRKAAATQDFEAVKPQVELMIRTEKADILKQDFLAAVRAKHPVVWNEKNLAAFRERFVKQYLSSKPKPAPAPGHHAK